MAFSKKADEMMSEGFSRYGRLISTYPYVAILVCLLVNGLLGLNILWMTSDSDLERTYTPTDSQADQDKDRLEQLFPDHSGTNFYKQSLSNLGLFGDLILTPINGNNILNKIYQSDLKHAVQTARVVQVTDIDNNIYSYSDLCARRNGRCIIDGEFLLDDLFWDNIYYDNTNISNANIIGLPRFENGTLRSAAALKIRLNLRQDSHTFNALSKQWEKRFLEIIGKVTLNHSQLAYQISDSLNIELDANTGGDITYFSLTFTLMITYASFVSAGGNCVSQRGHLGRAGVISAGLAILGSFGLVAALGVSFVNIVGVMPFLIIGIGVDDMFVMMSGLADTNPTWEITDRIAHVMKTSGVAITLTSLTNVIAFVAGISSVFKSVRNFCIFTATAVGFCYINQVTFFLGCMVLHERRVAQNRHCITCVPLEYPGNNENGHTKSGLNKFCCTGSPAMSRNEQESKFESLPRFVFPRLLLNKFAKFIVLLGYMAYLAFSILGVTRLQQGLVLQNLVSESSYYHKYSEWDFDFFPLQFITSFVISGKMNYSMPNVFEDIDSLLTKARQDVDMDDHFQLNWLNAYQQSNVYANASDELFMQGLRNFLNGTSLFQNDVVFDDDYNSILVSRFHLLSENIKLTFQQGQLMLRLREMASDSKLHSFAYSSAFVYFEQYIAVLPSTLQTVGIAVGAVFVTAFILMPNPFLILCVTLSLASVITGVLGFMHFWGLSLSSITMIHVIMSVGFSVDFSAHICHAFLTAEGLDRNSRVAKALELVVGPVVNSALSSVIGISMLALSESYVFISFFRVMLLVVLFGLFHGAFVLPVIFSLIGPEKTLKFEKFEFENTTNITTINGTVNKAYQHKEKN